jgi:hypothetical protein
MLFTPVGSSTFAAETDPTIIVIVMSYESLIEGRSRIFPHK